MTVPKDALHNETTLKKFLSFSKQIELWNNNFTPWILLFDGRFEICCMHLYTKGINFSCSPKLANLDSFKYMLLSFSYVISACTWVRGNRVWVPSKNLLSSGWLLLTKELTKSILIWQTSADWLKYITGDVNTVHDCGVQIGHTLMMLHLVHIP